MYAAKTVTKLWDLMSMGQITAVDMVAALKRSTKGRKMVRVETRAAGAV